MNDQISHIPVLLPEAVEALKVEPQAWYIDGTFGRGGHTQEILKQGGYVIAFDVDAEAIEYGQSTFAAEIEAQHLILVRENFDQIKSVLKSLTSQHHEIKPQGFLFDYGTSTQQLVSSDRGFSFESDQILDMRMDDRLGVKAADLLQVLPDKQLIELFQVQGGERESKAVVGAIKTWLRQHPQEVMTGKILAQVVSRAKYQPRGKLHPATKVFQALRIAVNSELDSIESSLNQIPSLASSKTRVVTIAFHEGEDRIVKQTFVQWEQQAKGHRINKDVIVPSENEVEHNPRSRSAKMRIFEYV